MSETPWSVVFAKEAINDLLLITVYLTVSAAGLSGRLFETACIGSVRSVLAAQDDPHRQANGVRLGCICVRASFPDAQTHSACARSGCC